MTLEIQAPETQTVKAMDLRHGDCLDVMRTMDDASVDLIVTSPPYNLRMTSKGTKNLAFGGKWRQPLSTGYADYSDDMPRDEYIQWQRECLTQMMRLIPDNGGIFYNHKWRIQDGLLDNNVALIVEGFPIRQVIIWQRKGGMNFNDSYFLPTYEVIYLIAKKDFKLSPKTNGVGDVWTFAQEQNNDHPAPFPLQLPYRCISSTSAKVVLDPFMGSGTTGLAARQLNRAFIGIEKSEKYYAQAVKRLSRDVVQRELF
jgi:site-specific DNA-methyltransferase (adenine-specific)